MDQEKLKIQQEEMITRTRAVDALCDKFAQNSGCQCFVSDSSYPYSTVDRERFFDQLNKRGVPLTLYVHMMNHPSITGLDVKVYIDSKKIRDEINIEAGIADVYADYVVVPYRITVNLERTDAKVYADFIKSIIDFCAEINELYKDVTIYHLKRTYDQDTAEKFRKSAGEGETWIEALISENMKNARTGRVTTLALPGEAVKSIDDFFTKIDSNTATITTDKYHKWSVTYQKGWAIDVARTDYRYEPRRSRTRNRY